MAGQCNDLQEKYCDRNETFMSHWDPNKLTHFDRYFDEDSPSYPRVNTC